MKNVYEKDRITVKMTGGKAMHQDIKIAAALMRIPVQEFVALAVQERIQKTKAEHGLSH